MNTDQQVRDAIRALADGRPDPDVDAAWDEVAPRLDRPAKHRGASVRRGAISLAAAAAVVVLALLARSDDDSGVRLDSAGEPDGAPPAAAEPAPREQPDDAAVGARVVFPADAIAVSGPEWQTVHVLDAGTGERAGTFGTRPGTQSLTSPTLTYGGDVWFVAHTDRGTRLGRARWDGGDGYDLLAPAAELTGASLGEVVADPHGRWVAVGAMDADGTCWLAVHAPWTGRWRAMRWPEGDQRGYYRCPQELSSSADGSQIGFLNVHDSDGTEPFEAFVVDADATSLADARLVADGVWDVTFDQGHGVLALTGPTRATATLRYLEGGPDLGVPSLDGVIDVQTSLAGIVARLETGWVRLDPVRDEWFATPLDRWSGR